MQQVQLSTLVRPMSDTGNTSTVIEAKDFLKQLLALKINPEVEYYTRADKDGNVRGHFRFALADGSGKVTPAVSAQALPNVAGATAAEKFGYCLKNLVLRTGTSSEGNKWLTFGVRGEGNLVKSAFNIQDYIKAIAGS